MCIFAAKKEPTTSKIWSVNDENTEAKKSAIEIELYGIECPELLKDNVPDTSDNNEEENLKTPSPLVIVHSSQPTLESNAGLIETHTPVPEPSIETLNVSEPAISDLLLLNYLTWLILSLHLPLNF